ncbi:carbohydrate-binding module family 20 domain-containing protein [Cellulomonas iranensis]|uniref:carbohydrate-binding module family 20 domain-containing protein n=1 Tax=Cellulomonas iranensis TaxID=76862 RepID=UPI0021F4212A|nr:carbohydrate-binding module family 20 domain-containing protein [Cellulomonas iranensis]
MPRPSPRPASGAPVPPVAPAPALGGATARRAATDTATVRRLTAAALALVLAAAALVVAAARPAAAGPPDDRPGVTLFQWTWTSIARECTDVLGPAGYGWVQTSPPQEHAVVGGQWWTSYQPVSYRIESKLGTRAEYAAMVSACRGAGVEVIADAVVNHMSGQTGGTGWAGTQFSTERYPGPAGGYGPQDFNDCRTNIASYQDRYQVQHCRLVGLQDLRTGSEYVRQEIADYLLDLVSLGVRGFRVDAAKHVPAADLEAILGKVRATPQGRDVYVVHEVIGAGGEPIQPAEYLGSGDSHEFSYARHLKGQVQSGRLASLRDLRTQPWLLPSDRAGVFVDNHDTERNGETLSYKDGTDYRLANVFMLAYPYGWPTVHSGYAFSDHDAGAPQSGSGEVLDAACGQGTFTCAHRWNETAHMVGFRNAVTGTDLTQWWDDGGSRIAFGRGDRGYVALNAGSSALTRTFATSLPAGAYCDVISGQTAGGACTGTTVTVDAAGRATFTVPAEGAVALHVGQRPSGTTAPTPTPTPTPSPTGAAQVAFGVTATTVWGQDLYVVGDHAALGGWDPARAVPLSSTTYPVWRATVTLPPGTAVQYKYVRKQGATVTWESGANRTLTVPASGTLTTTDTWRP